MWVMTSVETLGYSRPSLRDEEGQILAALDKNVGAPPDSQQLANAPVLRHSPEGSLLD